MSENDVEAGRTCDITTLNLSDQSTPAEQNPPQRYSLIVTSPSVRSNELTTPATAAATTLTKPDIITTDAATLNAISADFDSAMQRTIDAWKNETLPTTHPTSSKEPFAFNDDEDFLLADILQRSDNEQQNMLLRSLGTCPICGALRELASSRFFRPSSKSVEPIPSDRPQQ